MVCIWTVQQQFPSLYIACHIFFKNREHLHFNFSCCLTYARFLLLSIPLWLPESMLNEKGGPTDQIGKILCMNVVIHEHFRMMHSHCISAKKRKTASGLCLENRSFISPDPSFTSSWKSFVHYLQNSKRYYKLQLMACSWSLSIWSNLHRKLVQLAILSHKAVGWTWCLIQRKTVKQCFFLSLSLHVWTFQSWLVWILIRFFCAKFGTYLT